MAVVYVFASDAVVLTSIFGDLVVDGGDDVATFGLLVVAWELARVA